MYPLSWTKQGQESEGFLKFAQYIVPLVVYCISFFRIASESGGRFGSVSNQPTNLIT